ncbi:MAG TPA: hypothetical protein VFW76_05870, partial [Ktedonobacterales bacterium]|nr:hypothetical protein [Ktedonobacterales bacterium]
MRDVRTDTPAHRLASSYVGVRHTAPRQTNPTWSYESPTAPSPAPVSTTSAVASAAALPTSAPSSGRWRSPGAAVANPAPLTSLPVSPFAAPGLDARPDPQVWLIATVSAAGGMRPLEGAGRTGSIPVGRPYGFLRAIRPVMPPGALGNSLDGAAESGGLATRARRG